MKDKQFWLILGGITLAFLIYWFAGHPFFNANRIFMFVAIVAIGSTLLYNIRMAERGEEFYLRPIPGLKAVEEAVGRSTEMGKPVLFVPGIMDMDQVETVAGVIVLGHVSKMTARYETSLNVPVSRSIVMKAAREACRESYMLEGRPDMFNDDMVHYLTDDQFAYAAGVNGIMIREKPAACLYMGKFYAESLILAETGNSIGAIQIAGTASQAQIPFFVTACDYTLIGEEFFAASAYLSKKPELIGGVRGQDMVKIGVITLTLVSLFLFIGNLFEYSSSEEWKHLKNEYNLEADDLNSTMWNNLDNLLRYQWSNNTIHVPDSLLFNEFKGLDFIDLDKSKKNNFGLKTGNKYWFQIGFDEKEEKTNIKYALNNYDDYLNNKEFWIESKTEYGRNLWKDLDHFDQDSLMASGLSKEKIYLSLAENDFINTRVDSSDFMSLWGASQRSIPLIKSILTVQ